ncbi:unnamed protein product [Amoebophrya sp. A25]|nr:unnamed protein product [Amoebophrya sp. A25]|eukprot:GSA25T00006752001.1
MRLDKKEEQLLKLPPWLRDSMRPVISKHMSARQKFVLRQREKAEAEARREASGQEELFEVEDGSALDVDTLVAAETEKAKKASGASLSALAQNQKGGEKVCDSTSSSRNETADGLTTPVSADLAGIPIPKRFEEIKRAHKVDAIVEFNATYERYVKGISRRRQRVNVRKPEDPIIDLDAYWASCCEAEQEAEMKEGRNNMAEEQTLGSTSRRVVVPESTEDASGKLATGERREHQREKNVDDYLSGEGLDEFVTSLDSTGADARVESEAYSENTLAPKPETIVELSSDTSQEQRPLSIVDRLFASFSRKDAGTGTGEGNCGTSSSTNSTGDRKGPTELVRGGYSNLNLADPGAFANLPAAAKEAICPSPRALSGVHVYRNSAHVGVGDVECKATQQQPDEASGPLPTSTTTGPQPISSSIFSAAQVARVWEKGLDFLKPVVFDEPATRSGGTMPDKTLALALKHRDGSDPAKLPRVSDYPGASALSSSKSKSKTAVVEKAAFGSTIQGGPIQGGRASASSSMTKQGSDFGGQEKRDLSDGEDPSDEDASSDSGIQLDRKLAQWKEKERRSTNYEDIARVMKTDHPFRQANWMNDSTTREQEHIDGVRHGGAKDCTRGRGGHEDPDEDRDRQGAPLSGRTSRRVVFPELPDVEADWLNQKSTTKARSSACVTRTRADNMHGLKQMRLPETLKGYYKGNNRGNATPGSIRGPTSVGGVHGGRHSTSFGDQNMHDDSDQSFAPQEKKATAVQLQRILNNHLKDRNKRFQVARTSKGARM